MRAAHAGWSGAACKSTSRPGARTEELRALTWDHVFLKGRPDLDPPQPPHIAVWRSVRRSGDTKTREISRLVGHPGTAVTEEVYRKQIRPVTRNRKQMSTYKRL